MPIDIGGAVLEVVFSRPLEDLGPEESALEAIARYFRTLSGVYKAERGWPEWEESLNLANGPHITVSLANSTRTPVSPFYVDDTDPAQWKTGTLSIDAQLDLWTHTRYQRDRMARVVEDGLHNDLPFRTGLRLTSRNYYDRPLDIVAGEGRNTSEPDAAREGEWRRTWMLTISTDTVTVRDVPDQDTITVRAEVDDVSEPDLDIT